jgi:hypothetical protein
MIEAGCYMLRDGWTRIYKVGCSDDIFMRIQRHRSVHSMPELRLLAILPGSWETEALMKQALRAYRLTKNHREWFRLDNDGIWLDAWGEISSAHRQHVGLEYCT